jgi:hypothetical protein
MRFVVLICIHAILLSHLQHAIMQDIMLRDQAAAEAFWIESLNR